MAMKMNARLGVGLFAALLGATSGCVSTSLALPGNHPANPKAATLPLAFNQPLQAGSAQPAQVDDAAAAHAGHEHAEAVQAKPEAGEAWTCPMHPEVVRNGPGKCPICGMNLVKKGKSSEHQGGH